MKIIDTFTADTLQMIGTNPIQEGSFLNFRAVNVKLEEVSLGDVTAHFKVISVVPSLDTGVCMTQTEKLNKFITAQAGVLITVSMDLPFAPKRACHFAHARNHLLWSDYLYHDFAKKTDFFMTSCGLLCRAVLVLDDNNQIIYRQIANPVKSAINFSRLTAFLESRFGVRT